MDDGVHQSAAIIERRLVGQLAGVHLYGDGSWKADLVPGSFAITFLTGGRAGQTATIDKVSLIGLIGAGAKVLTAATVAPIVETVTYSNGDAWPRICHRSRVLVKMLSGDDDDHGGDRDRN